MHFRRFILFSIVILVLFFLLINTSLFQENAAKAASHYYVRSHYASSDFTFVNIAYDANLGNYTVTYKDNAEQQFSFTMTPRYFPVYVGYDPLDKHL
ncbi:Protein of unknown function [Paenibacillus algorifonticola]|uniref:DUF3139 domain-containing protein n=1 Tax=Paenibacillus algorifonticola TaxID=684063 RepID=A0A1I2HI01_9BACL|nr:DUF3139 domain-containing protein [Paenibacillus algorifonticola]SFF28930.1 Protein of unknown function [Paenibacillus algorifonticola]